jgi:hypothetical protein
MLTDEYAELHSKAEYGELDDENEAKMKEILLELDEIEKLTDAQMRELELLLARSDEEETHSPPGSTSRKKRQSKSRKQKKSRTRRQKKTQRKGRKQSNRK